jgi:hypothetical protein
MIRLIDLAAAASTGHYPQLRSAAGSGSMIAGPVMGR